MTRATGWDNGLTQDYSRALSRWFSSKLGAKHQARLVAQEIKMANSGIGDITSDAPGSGARYNAGKTDYALVPLKLMAETLCTAFKADSPEFDYAVCILHLGQFQAERTRTPLLSILHLLGLDGWEECAQVFDYGRRKYAEWNWAKGMPWSAPLASAVRHLLDMLGGVVTDPESGISHRGHVFCNIVMLLTYMDTYKEGDDLPPKGRLA